MELGRMELLDRIMYVARVSEKPTTDEITEHLKIILAGMFAMGIVGFVIYLLFRLMMLS